MKKFIQNYWSLTFIAIQPILYLYNNNSYFLFPSYLVRPILITLFFTALLTFILAKIIKDKNKVFYLMQIFLIFFFSYGFYLKLGVTDSSLFFLVNNSLITVIPYVILYFVLSALVFIPKVNYKKISDILARIFLIVFLINLVLFTYFQISTLFTSQINPEKTMANNLDSPSKPDIYLIVLDGHARQDVLKETYSYDGSSFVNSLRDRKFNVDDDAITNYVQTYLSIASLFKMDYLNPRDSGVSDDSSDRIFLLNTLAENQFIKSLQKNNYEMFIYNTGWTGSEALRKLVGSSNFKGMLTEFEFGVINNSIIPMFVGNDLIYKSHASRTRYIFKDIPNIAKKDYPTFTYAHLLVPHPPFVYKENGESATETRLFTFIDSEIKDVFTGGKEYYQKSYVDQLKYVDKLALETIDGILENSKTPPIILVISDHGPGKEFSYYDVSDEGIKERFSVLRAVYFPDQNYKDLDQVNSHLNLLRVVLNNYFSANIPYIEDKTLLHSPWAKPYDFLDVTDRYFIK